MTGQIQDRANGTLALDFSSLGGPTELTGTYDKVDAKIYFDDEKKTDWNALTEFPVLGGNKSGIQGDIGGVFYDLDHVSETVGLKGLRYVSAFKNGTPVDEITIVGSDDGIDFWVWMGKYVNKADGKFQINDTAGTFDDEGIKLDDGSRWQRA